MKKYITKIRIALVTLLALFLSNVVHPQSGCTDPQATNYDEIAVDNDGSCLYGLSSQVLNQLYLLSPANPNLAENSALELNENGDIWILNDGGAPPVIMLLEASTGFLMQSVDVSNATNVDWEELAQSPDHLYIGDFGNNLSGDRDDLIIYRLLKSDLSSDVIVSVTAEVINFIYPEQGEPVFSPLDSTKYDCESMIWLDDEIHLFTKNWLDFETSHYVIPDVPGTHEAQLVESFDVNGLITAADITEDGTIVLLGYDAIGSSFLWLLWDYQPGLFFSGNKRRIELGLVLNNGQTEGLIFSSPDAGYVSSEHFFFGDFINVPAQLMTFDIGDYFTGISEPIKNTYRFWPVPTSEVLYSNLIFDYEVEIYTAEGERLANNNFHNGEMNVSHLTSGSYVLKISELQLSYRFIKVGL